MRQNKKNFIQRIEQKHISRFKKEHKYKVEKRYKEWLRDPLRFKVDIVRYNQVQSRELEGYQRFRNSIDRIKNNK